MMDRVSRGDRTKVRCLTKLDDGSWIGDAADRETPLWIKAGEVRSSLRAITEAVVGMKIGEQKTFSIAPREAFGLHDDAKVLSVSLTSLPSDIEVGEWAPVAQAKFRGDALVVRKDEAFALVDGNHPLAGETLHVELQVLAIDRQK